MNYMDCPNIVYRRSDSRFYMPNSNLPIPIAGASLIHQQNVKLLGL